MTQVFAALSYPLGSMITVAVASLAGVGVLGAFGGAMPGDIEADPAYIGMFLVCLGLTGMLCVWQSRVTERQREELAELSRTDPLTGCLNRRGFEERFGAELSRARREGTEVALVLVDLDHFKAVNDRHGHPAGDRVLVQTAACLRAVSRFGDHVARVGGEEFAWILPNTDGEAAIRAAERVRCAMAAVDFGDVAAATLSIGVCELAVAGEAGRLYELADVALYRAKAAGRDRCVLLPPL
jgi:diguanylate cyclase (GGDEF)-like protein